MGAAEHFEIDADSRAGEEFHGLAGDRADLTRTGDFDMSRRRHDVAALILAGIGYGVLLWIVMYWIVMPLRFDMPLPRGITAVAQQLFAHCLLVGVPIAWIAAGAFRREGFLSR